MSWWEALILGIVQGLTEFLPVSSSGHLELVKAMFGDDSVPEESLLMTVLLHGATALSTIVVFRKDILNLIIGVFKKEWNFEKKYVLFIALSMIPVGLVGVFFEDEVEGFFAGNVLLVGCMLIVTGLLLLFTHFYKPKEGQLTFGKAALVGIAQGIAILPGISRSGSTIATSLLLGVKKEEAARFSFLMVLPPIIGIVLLKLKDVAEAPTGTLQIDGAALAIGFVAAFIAGIAACNWMITIVKRSKLTVFAIYCFVVGGVAIAWGMMGS